MNPFSNHWKRTYELARHVPLNTAGSGNDLKIPFNFFIILAIKEGFSMACELMKSCFFFVNSPADSNAVELLKDVYCRGNQQQCARYRIAQAVGREHVPPTLYPNQTHRVEGIIKKARA